LEAAKIDFITLLSGDFLLLPGNDKRADKQGTPHCSSNPEKSRLAGNWIHHKLDRDSVPQVLGILGGWFLPMSDEQCLSCHPIPPTCFYREINTMQYETSSKNMTRKRQRPVSISQDFQLYEVSKHTTNEIRPKKSIDIIYQAYPLDFEVLKSLNQRYVGPESQKN
jgi:hypothetical protein